MESKSLLILHLSDAHMRDREDMWASKAEKLALAVRAQAVACDAVLIAFTGDIAYAGLESDYKIASAFVSQLQAGIRTYFIGEIHFVCTPGNHDCVLGGDQDVRQSLLNGLKKEPTKPYTDQIIAECSKVLTEFENFRKSSETITPTSDDLLWKQYSFRVGSHVVGVQTVNTAWSSERKMEPSNIPFPVSRARAPVDSSSSLRILLTHLPYHWIKQELYREFRRVIRRDADLVLTGHEHEINSGYTFETDTGATAFVEGGALLAHGQLESSTFATIQVSLPELKLTCEHYAWVDNHYELSNEEAPQQEIVLNRKAGAFRLNSAALEYFHELGASIAHPAKLKVNLQDLFVYPELQYEGDAENTEQSGLVVDSKTLVCATTQEARNCLVRGEQSSGKSALLKSLFVDAVDAGLVPIFLQGKQLARSSKKELQQLIDRSIREHYETACHEAAIQAPRSSRVLFIDNIDRYAFPSKHFASALEFLGTTCGQIVATADQLFDLQESLLGASLSPLREFDQYQIIPLGVKRRHALIKKWFELESESSRELSLQRAKNSESASKVISSVLAKGLIPKYPLYVLILLQGIEVGHSNELENSALGQYYEYLILHSLLPAINQDSLKEVLNYCEQFAWLLHDTKKDRMSDAELRRFHMQFEQSHDVEIQFEQRKRALVEAKIWTDGEGEIKFRYPYAYFFFIGRYLARNFGRPEVRKLAETYADALHVRDHGNALLFLAHHSDDLEVFDMLARSVEKRFSNCPVLKFDNDTQPLDELVGGASQLAYVGHQTDVRRHQIVEQDETVAENLNDAERGTGESEDPEKAALNLLADLSALFKGIEIMGMALKADYGDLKSADKQKYLATIVDSGLRGLRGYIEAFSSEPEYIVRLIEEKLLTKSGVPFERRNEIAKRVVFKIMSTSSLIFVRKIGGSIGSKNLYPAIKRLVTEDKSSAYRLVEIAALLETPGPIPISKLKALNDEFKSKPFALDMLGRLALTRVYLS